MAFTLTIFLIRPAVLFPSFLCLKLRCVNVCRSDDILREYYHRSSVKTPCRCSRCWFGLLPFYLFVFFISVPSFPYVPGAWWTDRPSFSLSVSSKYTPLAFYFSSHLQYSYFYSAFLKWEHTEKRMVLTRATSRAGRKKHKGLACPWRTWNTFPVHTLRLACQG